MKKVLILAVLMVTAVMPSMAQKINYSISGTYTENGETIYLIDELTDQKIDSVVVAKGEFSFKGAADKDAFMSVSKVGNHEDVPFFNDGTPIHINLNEYTLKGSPQNERLAKYYFESEAPRRKVNEKIRNMSEEEIEQQAEALVDEINKCGNITITVTNKIFEEERNSLIPLAFAQVYFVDHGLDAYDELVAEKVAFANHPYLKKAHEEVQSVLGNNSAQEAFVGKQYTDLEMADPDGKMHKVSEFVGEGKWVLVDFWASWCGPCRAEMPNVLEAYNKYHSKGFEVIGISFDQKKEAWVKAVEQLNMPWLQISDLKAWESPAASIYKIEAIPDNILIDPQGKIVNRALRGTALQTRLKKIFGE